MSSLDEKQAQSLEAGGSDLVAFTVEGTAASALATGEIARILCIGTGIEERQLRALASLPVDAFLLSMKDVSGTWTLQDLATVGAISRRVDKYILVEVSAPPGNKDLEALRDIGVSGVVVDVGALGATKLKKLKTSLLEMPRHRSRRRERIRATLPGLVYGAAPEPQQEEDDEDDDDE